VKLLSALAVAALAAVPLPGDDMAAIAPGQLEGRPSAPLASPLQASVDATPPGGTLHVEAGEYRGDLCLERSIHLVGHGQPRLVGSGTGTVVRVRAPDVIVDGFAIDGLGGGDLGRDSSGVHVSAPRVTVRNCEIRRALFGVYLREAHDAVVERCRIYGIPGKDPGEKGSGIHVWNTEGFRLEGNLLVDVRDGLYIQSSSKGTIRTNEARDMRYGLHYMFSDDNTFEDNTFVNGAAGTALMYSRRITFRRNCFLHNRGFASVGLLFKACDDVVAEDNLLADNARGIFIEGSYRNVFRGNVVAESDVAVVVYDSSAENRFEGNSFVGNLSPLDLVGRRTDTVFLGNYYSDNTELDLDGDGRCDRPFRLSSTFDHLRGNLTAADLFAQSFAAAAVAAAERAFPVMRAVPVEDPSPLRRPPSLPRVPAPLRRGEGASRAGLLSALASAGVGALVLRGGWRPSSRKRRQR
jgi:nitrous oxidase accessory protein